MKYAFVLFLIAGNLIGCAGGGSSSNDSNSSYTPASLLPGQYTFATFALTIDINGTFFVNQTIPTSCFISGTYHDNNSGAHAGTVTFYDISNTCGASGSVTDNYVLANGFLTLSN